LSTEEVKSHISHAAPLRRIGRPEDIAAAVLWLCSDEASFIMGEIGGIELRWKNVGKGKERIGIALTGE